MPTEFEPFYNFIPVLVQDKPTPKVERVIFNGPATIVFWDDGEKTVVKCRECCDGGCMRDRADNQGIIRATEEEANYCNESYDVEKAVMAAMLKRLYKNYQDVLRDALEDGDE